MTKEQQKLVDFHRKFGLTVNKKPVVPRVSDAALRINLIDEEAKEFRDASIGGSDEEKLIAVADALGDLLYVIYGAAVTYGIDLEPVFDEIHRSNMSKVWIPTDFVDTTDDRWAKVDKCEGGLVVRDKNGKVIKPPSYSPANLKPILFP